jgi:hypothetical protein
MIKQLEKLFTILFMNSVIIDIRLKAFVQNFLKKLAIQNTANQFDTMLNDTEAKYTAFFGDISDKDTITAIKEARTMSVNNVIVEVGDFVRANVDFIASKLGRTHPDFHEIFPNQPTEYYEATKTNIEVLLHRLVTGCTTFEAQLGLQLKTDAIALETKYLTARGGQISKMGELENQRNEVHDSRTALAIQMQNNLFDLAKLNIGHPERFKLFFSLHLLLPHWYKNDIGEIVYDEITKPVPRNSQVDSGLTFTPDTVFEFYNDGTVPIIVMLCTANENQTVPASPITIMPDELREIKAGDMGAASCLFLRLINQSTDTDGQLTIDILS